MMEFGGDCQLPIRILHTIQKHRRILRIVSKSEAECPHVCGHEHVNPESIVAHMSFGSSEAGQPIQNELCQSDFRDTSVSQEAF